MRLLCNLGGNIAPNTVQVVQHLSEKVVNYFMLKLSLNNSWFCFQFHLIKSGVEGDFCVIWYVSFVLESVRASLVTYLFFSTAGNWSCGGAPEAAKVRYFGKCESISGYLFFQLLEIAHVGVPQKLLRWDSISCF